VSFPLKVGNGDQKQQLTLKFTVIVWIEECTSVSAL